jgi:hypothetical protein
MVKQRATSNEFDLHFWVKPEDADTQQLITISHGCISICIDATRERALETLRELLENY